MSIPETAEKLERTIVQGFGPDRLALERRLQADGIPLAVVDRVALLPSLGHADAALVVVAERGGAALRAANIAATRSRALLAHRRLRVSRFGASDRPGVDDQLLRWIAEYARADFRCLGLTVELFERDAPRRARLASTLASLGFTSVKRRRSYRTTIALDLTPTADELLRNLHRDTRRDVRAPLKHNMELRVIDDVSLAERLEYMVALTFSRTGGTPPKIPWPAIIAMSGREPALSRISGVFDTRITGPESLVSFAWGINRGTYTTYEAGAAVRRKDLGNLPLGYAPVWDLVTWARQISSEWFDFGGVTPGRRATPNDPVGGISAFKRSFCTNVVEVGEEWVLYPHPVRAAVAELFGSAARIMLQRNRGFS